MRLFTVSRGLMQKLASSTPSAGFKTSSSIHRLFNANTSNSLQGSRQQQAFYDQLKKEERRQFGRKRIRVDFQSNTTGALTLDFSETELKHHSDDEMVLLNRCKSHIIEHASRRVDLFFYTLIGYYKTFILPVEGHTNFQYGVGRPIGNWHTQACHSSFTPSFLDKTILQNKESTVNHKSLLSRTHFLQSLNATVELPAFVNGFDDILESICRPYCFAILRDVAADKMDPIAGLACFLSKMNKLLLDFKEQASKKNYHVLTYPHLHIRHYVNPMLIELVIEGTLAPCYDSTSSNVNDDYLQLLLRLTPQEKRQCGHNEKRKEKIYLQKIMALQREILETESVEQVCAI